MLWLMAGYANDVAKRRDLGIQFQALVPQQIIGDTALGRAAANGYAGRNNVDVAKFLAGFGAPLPPRQVGEHVAALLTEERYASGLAFGLKGDTGIVPLDAR